MSLSSLIPCGRTGTRPSRRAATESPRIRARPRWRRQARRRSCCRRGTSWSFSYGQGQLSDAGRVQPSRRVPSRKRAQLQEEGTLREEASTLEGTPPRVYLPRGSPARGYRPRRCSPRGFPARRLVPSRRASSKRRGGRQEATLQEDGTLQEEVHSRGGTLLEGIPWGVLPRVSTPPGGCPSKGYSPRVPPRGVPSSSRLPSSRGAPRGVLPPSHGYPPGSLRANYWKLVINNGMSIQCQNNDKSMSN